MTLLVPGLQDSVQGYCLHELRSLRLSADLPRKCSVLPDQCPDSRVQDASASCSAPPFQVTPSTSSLTRPILLPGQEHFRHLPSQSLAYIEGKEHGVPSYHL